MDDHHCKVRRMVLASCPLGSCLVSIRAFPNLANALIRKSDQLQNLLNQCATLALTTSSLSCE